MNHPTRDNEILRYYEAEMRYLREAGKEFAQAFPDRARMLNIDRIGERDPHVERLFEGFAFLMGRLRHKLDDELPELTEGLVSMLWPHYLRMIPSLSILELIPTAGALQRHDVIERRVLRAEGGTADLHDDRAIRGHVLLSPSGAFESMRRGYVVYSALILMYCSVRSLPHAVAR